MERSVNTRELGGCFIVCTLLLIGLVIRPGLLLAADWISPHGKVDGAVVKRVEWELRTFAKKTSELETRDKETIFPLLANFLWKNPDLYGTGFACAPEMKEGKAVKTFLYIYRSGDKLIQKDLSDNYDYTASEHEWYAKPMKLERTVWTERYFDKDGGEVWVATFSVPVYSAGKERRLIGVLASDVLLSRD